VHLTDPKPPSKGSVHIHVVLSCLSEPTNSNQTIEVRLGPQGVKAKYVRVELRKIESLPGVPPNSYYDFVGQSPVNLWQSSEEYMHAPQRGPVMTTLFSRSLNSRPFPSARYSFLHSNTRVHSPDSHARKWWYVLSPYPFLAPLIAGALKLVLNTSLSVKCAFEASRTYPLLMLLAPTVSTLRQWILPT
jgi:hypothetical protein